MKLNISRVWSNLQCRKYFPAYVLKFQNHVRQESQMVVTWQSWAKSGLDKKPARLNRFSENFHLGSSFGQSTTHVIK